VLIKPPKSVTVLNYDSILRELGFLPPLPKHHDRGALVERIRSSARGPSPLAKALTGLNAKMGKLTSGRRQAVAVNDLAARRARCAELNEQATMLAKSGELTAEQGAQIDVLLHRYAAEHCE
jgi:hypothetical protein